MKLMSDKEWDAIQDDPKLPLQKRGELYAQRLLARVDWDNMDPEFAAQAKRTLRKDAIGTVLKAGGIPAGADQRRPRDIVLP